MVQIPALWASAAERPFRSPCAELAGGVITFVLKPLVASRAVVGVVLFAARCWQPAVGAGRFFGGLLSSESNHSRAPFERSAFQSSSVMFCGSSNAGLFHCSVLARLSHLAAFSMLSG